MKVQSKERRTPSRKIRKVTTFGGNRPQKVEEIGKRGEGNGRKDAKSVGGNTWKGA